MLVAPFRRRAADPIAWNDVEALPLHAATLLLTGVLVCALADLTPVLQGMSVKAACIVGCLGLRTAWLGMDEARGTRPLAR